MKKFLFFLLAAITISNINAQTSFIEKNFASVLENEDVTRVQVGTKAFALMTTFLKANSDEDAKKVASVSDKVKFFDLIVIPEKTGLKAMFESSVKKASNLEELIKVKSKEANVSIRIDEKNDVIYEVIGLIAADSVYVVFDLVGEFRLDEISELVSKVNTSNMGKVLNSRSLNFTDAKIYPNPVSKGESVNLEIPETLKNGMVSIIDANGKKVSELKAPSEPNMTIDTSTLIAGSYNITVELGGVSVTKRLIVVE